jgi:hypothetical protein
MGSDDCGPQPDMKVKTKTGISPLVILVLFMDSPLFCLILFGQEPKGKVPGKKKPHGVSGGA